MPQGINIETGYETYVSVSRQVINKLGSPYSDCLEDLSSENEYAKLLFTYFDYINFTYYDQNMCFTLCFQDKLIDKCNCSAMASPLIRESKYCSNDIEMNCLYDFQDEFVSSDINEFCQNACPIKCNTVDYTLKTSKAKFPTLTYLKNQQHGWYNGFYFPQNVSDRDLMNFARSSFLRLIINYDNLYVTKIAEKPKMTSNDLFGLLGGQLGLFLGSSLISLSEILLFIISIILIFSKSCTKKL